MQVKGKKRKKKKRETKMSPCKVQAWTAVTMRQQESWTTQQDKLVPLVKKISHCEWITLTQQRLIRAPRIPGKKSCYQGGGSQLWVQWLKIICSVITMSLHCAIITQLHIVIIRVIRASSGPLPHSRTSRQMKLSTLTPSKGIQECCYANASRALSLSWSKSVCFCDSLTC